MAGKALNPADTVNSTPVKPAYVANADAGRLWYKDCTNPATPDGTEPKARDLNMFLYNLRYAADQFAVADDDGEDYLYKVLNAAGWPAVFILADITKTVGPASDFATIAAAYDWLKTKIIAKGVFVTLQFTSGVHTIATTISLDYKYGTQVKWKGAAMLGADPNAAAFVITGSGSGPRATDNANHLTMLRARYATELRFSGGARLEFVNSGFGLMDDLLIVGDGSTGGGGVRLDNSRGTVGTVSAHAWGENGFAVMNGSVLEIQTVFTGSDCDLEGLRVDKSVQTGDGAIVCCSNGQFGVQDTFAKCERGTTVNCRGNGGSGHQNNYSDVLISGVATLSTNASNGSITSFGRTRFGSAPVVASNGVSGITAKTGGVVAAVNAVLTTNTTYGFLADEGSFINAVGASATGSVSNYSPAINTVGNANSYIKQ